ncbi:MAG TPA: AAA family ATPase [Candidatus Blautia faecipullorum]|nr:AAA family ATPase [Candidatus Blautia faecipullorum]
MRYSDKDCIVIGFDEDRGHLTSVILMSGKSGLRKMLQGISGKKEMEIYHVNFADKTCMEAGRVSLPQDIPAVDMVIEFKPEEDGGTVTICNTDQVWSYTVLEKSQEAEKNPMKSAVTLSQTSENETAAGSSKYIVDKDKVRELEQKKQTKTVWPDELAAELKRGIYGQDEAIKKISELISANLRRKKPEVEVIVLFGPTGVGKTEVGKALPGALEKLTGQAYGFHQIALNEFIGEHSVNRFFGSPPSYIGYKDPTVFEPVRSNPYQVFLLDEIEKATDRIYTGLMECFSSGVVHLADNSPDIDLSHVIFVITSNIPVDMKVYEEASAFRKKEICRNTLAKACGHPEIAGKITNCLAFRELPADALTDIVSKFVVEELQNYEMELEHMDEELMVQLKEQHSNYGARGVRDAVREAITAATVYDRNIGRYKGHKVLLSGDIENIVITIVPEEETALPAGA